MYKENWPRPLRPCFFRYLYSLNNFCRGSPKDHSYEIILEIRPVVLERKIFKVFYIAIFGKLAFAPGGHIFWDIKILWTTFVEVHQRIIPVKLFWNQTSSFAEEDFQSFLYSHIWKTGPASGGHAFWDIIILWTSCVEVYPRIIPVKLFWNLTSSFGEEDFQSFYIAI